MVIYVESCERLVAKAGLIQPVMHYLLEQFTDLIK